MYSIKLVHSSAIDPEGILMLNSIREIFDLIGIKFDSMKFVSEKIDQPMSVIRAINNQRKCPAIVAAKFDFTTRPISVNAHVMVAAGVKSKTIRQGLSFKRENFVQCKNSYRNDPNQAGKFQDFIIF